MPDMRQTDVAIVGGGLAGSTAAAMLSRAGIRAVLIDPHPTYPPDFRCEKLDASQIAVLRKTGLCEAVQRAATPDLQVWIARFGRLIDKRGSNTPVILTQTHARHILIRLNEVVSENDARNRLNGLRARIEQGADFAELARLQSDDTSAAKGGDLS